MIDISCRKASARCFVNPDGRPPALKSEPPRKGAGSLTWLSKYLSLALTLPASVAAGYILGAVADRWLNLPILRAVGILLGMASGLITIFRELARDHNREDTRP